jgi:LacI family transcriptional regulator
MTIKKSTLQDVANYANVSTATVSRCLNQPDKVKQPLQEKIRQAIKALGYVPHGAARALASKRTFTIGAVVPTIDNAIFSEAIQYLQRGLTKAGYTLLLAQSNYSLDDELHEVQTLLTQGVEGLVLVGEDHHQGVFDAIEQHRIPLMNIWTYSAESKYSCIGIDNTKAGQRIAEHLVALNHKNIGVISGILRGNDRAQHRLQGAGRYLQQQGIKLSPTRIMECRYSGEQGRLAMHELMVRHPDTTAVFCGNDILALGALCAARELGLSVPKDISITGFDDIEMIAVISPALTTMNSPSRRMGIQAAEYLIQQIQLGTRSVERCELSTDLIVRETTGQAAS